MRQPVLANMPLLGALCVAAGLISETQLEACLQLQGAAYQGTPIGQILVLRGYLSQQDLARMVAQQQAFRRTFYQAIEHTDVLAISQAPTAALPSTNAAGRDTPTGSAMPELGLFAEAEIDTSPLFGALR